MTLREGRNCRARAAWWLTAAAFISTLGTGCASATSWRPVRTVPSDAFVLPVEGRLQEGDRCGPNALAMLFAAAGSPIDEPTIAKAVQNDRLNASLNIDLVLFARAQGFPARFETGTIERIIERIDNRTPPLLMMRLERRSKWGIHKELLWHYIVVYGYSRAERVLLAHSGWGPRRITFDEIEAPWEAAGHWMMNLGQPVNPRARFEYESGQ